MHTKTISVTSARTDVMRNTTVSNRTRIAVFALCSIFTTLIYAGPNDPQDGGAWSSVQGWPMIPVSAANLPDGRVVAWASNERTSFPAGPEFTYTAVWDPQSNTFTEIPHPSHDMFCSHHVMMEDGKVFVSGGRNQGSSPWTSVFNPQTNQWEVLPNMNRGRWYPTSVLTGDGKVITSIGSGGGNTAEIWDGTNWTLMGGLNFDGPILNYTHGERNWWPIMHLAPDGRIFHSGPTPALHMIDTSGSGSLQQTNTHTDWYPKHGATVMYDEGKLLTAGGWVNGTDLTSSARSLVVDLNGPNPTLTEVAPMIHARKFHNGVTLPNGEVLIIGGNTSGQKFNDTGTVYPVEIWNPSTETWREGASMSVPRNYHSIALLMLDGRVLSGGGGLCNCAADHQDSQIYSPPYLFNTDGTPAARPVITRVPSVVTGGSTVDVSASPGLAGFSIVKMSSTTHAMNTDLRYLPLSTTEVSPGEYSVTLHGNPNVLTAGHWMLFALNTDGTPSVAKVIRVSSTGLETGPPTIKQMSDMGTVQGTPLSLAVVYSDPDGDTLTLTASGLPNGLMLNSSSGVISGVPNTAGTFTVTITVDDASDGSASTTFQWTVIDASNPPGVAYEYYEGNWDLLPDFDTLTTVGAGVLPNFSLAPRNQNNEFGFRFTGRLIIDTAGTYTFFTNSDDGSQLFIDGALVVDNDGLHAPREASGTATLTAGAHNFVVTFFEKGGGEVLTVSYQGPGIGKQAIPDAKLRLPTPTLTGRYLRFSALSEVNGKPWASAAEFNLLDANGQPYNRAAWTVTATSEELTAAANGVGNAFDGDVNSIWHTEYASNAGDDQDPPHPHDVIVDMGTAQPITGLRYLPRAGGGNGTVAQYAIYLSDSALNWGSPIASGTFAAGAAEKTVTFTGSQPTNTPPVAINPGNQVNLIGDSVSLLIDASDADGQPLAFTATDLPFGLAINSATGLISGTTTTVGNHTTTVIVDDGTDTATVSFAWSINSTNIAPTLSAIADQIGVVADVVSVSVQASDANADPLTFSAAGLPPGVSIATNSGTMSGTLSSAGSFSSSVTVTDGALSATQNFDWTVAAANIAPVLSAVADQVTDAGTNTALQLVANDANGDTLTYSATGLPSGILLNSTTGLLSGAPTSAGSYAVTATVTDGALSDGTTFSWTVNEPIIPIAIASLGNAPVVAGSTIAFSASATGTGPLEYRWTFADGSAVGNFETSPGIDHVFANPGRYLVTLEVRNAFETASTSFTQAVHAAHTPSPARASSTIITESSTGSERVWNVNPDNDTVGVIDATTRSLVTEIAVGDNPTSLAPAPGGDIWVINRGSASISRISPVSLNVTETVNLPVGSEPFALVFNPQSDQAFVSVEGLRQIRSYNGTTGVELNQIDVGANVRHLSISGDGTTLYANRFITPLLPGESGVNPSASANAGGEVLVIDTQTAAVSASIILTHSNAGVSEHSGPGLPNYLRATVISPDGINAYVPSKQDNVLDGQARSGRELDHDHTVRSISSHIDLQTSTASLTNRIDHDNASLATAAAYDASGSYLFVALEGNRMIAAVDAYRGEELFRFMSGRAPQGVVVGADGNTLYSHNFMDRTVTVHDVSTLITTGANDQTLLATVPVVGSEVLAANVLLGKQHFYDSLDPRLALESYMSCASCHNEGDSDGRVWDFTQFGEGVRNTTSLIGQAGANRGPVHWTGNFDEIQDFEGQIRSFARGLGLMSDADFNAGTRSQPLGDSKSGLNADLDALAAYVNSLSTVGTSPYRPAVDQHSADALTGFDLFQTLNCASCHAGDGFSDSAVDVRHDVGSLTTASGQRLGAPLDGLDTPSLKGLWRTSPYLHDGSASNIADAIIAHSSLAVSSADAALLQSYLLETDDAETANAGACTDCLDFTSVGTTSYSNQDAAGNVQVIDEGRGLLLTDNTWRKTDTTYTVTPNTIVEFQFQSSIEGEIQGLGLDEDDSLSSDRLFKVHGSQAWGIRNFDNYSGGGIATYRIPVGQFYTGSNMRLVFVNDYDAGSGNTSRFTDVRVFERGANTAPAMNGIGDRSTRAGSTVNFAVDASDLDGDALAFSATGLPPGLVINTNNGNVTGAPTTEGTYDVLIEVSDGSTTDSKTFAWTITASGCVDCLDFSSLPTESYGGQDRAQQIQVLDGGGTVLLTGNTWRRTIQTYNVTANTVIEFEFSSTLQGEIHGIGFDANNSLSSNRIFKVHGTQNWGLRNFDTYGSGTQTFRIPVGQFYTGGAMHLVLTNDRDSGSGNDSRFSNIRIFED